MYCLSQSVYLEYIFERDQCPLPLLKKEKKKHSSSKMTMKGARFYYSGGKKIFLDLRNWVHKSPWNVLISNQEPVSEVGKEKIISWTRKFFITTIMIQSAQTNAKQHWSRPIKISRNISAVAKLRKWARASPSSQINMWPLEMREDLHYVVYIDSRKPFHLLPLAYFILIVRRSH